MIAEFVPIELYVQPVEPSMGTISQALVNMRGCHKHFHAATRELQLLWLRATEVYPLKLSSLYAYLTRDIVCCISNKHILLSDRIQYTNCI